MNLAAASQKRSTRALLPDSSRHPLSAPLSPFLRLKPLGRAPLQALAILCGVSLCWWLAPAAASGQPSYLPDAVAGTAGIRELVRALDSLALRSHEIDVEKAEGRVSETSLWRRILPDITCSARLGFHEIFFYDPATALPGLQIPRDAYGLSLSISLTRIFDGSSHREAELELERLQAERVKFSLLSDLNRSYLSRKRTALVARRPLLESQLAVVADISSYDSLRFQEGKLGFDAFRRSCLALLSVKMQLQDLESALLDAEYPQSGGAR